MEIEKEKILQKHIFEKGVNLFLGAGFSSDAYNRDKEKLPLGENLKKILIDEFNLDQFESLSLSQLSGFIKKTQRGDFHRFLHRKYKVLDFDKTYNYLDLISIRNIFTLNIDDLVERIFEQADRNNILYDIKILGSSENDGINFCKLHGSITYPSDNDLLFTPEELSILFTKEQSRFHMVAQKIASKPTLFWGTRLEDANVLSLISKETTKGAEPQEKWIVITPGREKDAIAEYFRTMDFNIIRGVTIDLLNYFNENHEIYHPATVKKNSQEIHEVARRHFPSNYIDEIIKKQHPVRPIKSFFAGDDPVWSDILEKKIIKLSIYEECFSKTMKNNIVFITGGIGCGKSTLLMQLSVDENIEGLKFYFNSLTKPKAIKLNEILENQHGDKIIFIDNICDNIDSFVYLKDIGMYKIICADRDLTYDKVKHKIRFKNDEIVDITELPDRDIQAICDLAHNTTFSRSRIDKKMSLFEVAYYVWEGKRLTSKIDNLITELSSNYENNTLLEFFTLMTYVRSCNISASMDMLLLYYDAEDGVNYKTIYKYANKLKSMIDDEDHFTIGFEQDFFTLRSHLFAELCLRKLPSDVLAKVLKKFSSNVHRDCIVRYDIFKRKGYDADITTLAFHKIEDGIDYYENILSMDKSEYRYQQYALYLFRKNKIKEAWSKIEIAHSINPNNLAIKNTHAYILFNNNIKIEDYIETVKETIDYTFDVISDCIKKDMRKTFHVITFAENSIVYFRKFINTEEYRFEANKYIDTAYTYVCDEIGKHEFVSKSSKVKLRNLKKEIEEIKRV